MMEGAHPWRWDEPNEGLELVMSPLVTMLQSLAGYYGSGQEAEPDHPHRTIECQEKDSMTRIVPWDILRQHAGNAAFELHTKKFTE